MACASDSLHQLLELGRRRHRAEESRIEHGIEQTRAAGKDRGKPRRGPHDVGDEPQQAWIGGKEREELHAGRHLGHDLVEGGEREVRFGGAAENIEQRGEEFGEALAGAGAARCGVAAGLPGADRGDGLLGIAEAELLKRGKGGGIAFVARQHDARSGLGQRRQLFEQRAVMALDLGKLRDQSVGESIGIGKAGQRGHPAQFVRLVRQRVGLLIADHLQPVLDPAQEEICVGEVVRPPSARSIPLSPVPATSRSCRAA